MVILTENVEHLLELRVVVVGEAAFGRDVDDENDFAAKRLEADVVAVTACVEVVVDAGEVVLRQTSGHA